MESASCSVTLPAGFVELPRERTPSVDRLIQLAHEWQAALGVENPAELTEGSVQTAAMLAATGAAAGVTGSAHVSAAIYRSPEASRPVMVLVSTYLEETGHSAVTEALESVEKLSAAKKFDDVRRVTLPAGQAVLVETAHSSRHDTPAGPVTVTSRSLSAWIPSPNLPQTAVIEVSSNNAEDWAHVSGLAKEIFQTFSWDEE
ncbi:MULTISPECIES: hypothetical protein [Thermocrispum]|jgi:hypothetical protein|uniref:Uncharacterized protein n=1 Tax=Thermocrispum agreste TaxID=37925 RepID=A0A2W4J6E4_9PSEU|nr:MULTISPECIES: hypothetical protein [Thermocrispum]PZM94732.1 MAG: hypothetical protein DIU77_13615 [Thermocrispum agreste]